MLALLFLLWTANAADVYWTCLGGSGSWNASGCWSSGAVPTPGDVVYISSANVTLPASSTVVIQGIRLEKGATLIFSDCTVLTASNQTSVKPWISVEDSMIYFFGGMRNYCATSLLANGGQVQLTNSLILWRDCVVTGNTTIVVDRDSSIVLTDFHYWNNTHRSLNHNIYGGSFIYNYGTFIADPTSGDVVFDGGVVNYGTFTLQSTRFRCFYASNWATSKFINHGIFNNSAACWTYMQMVNFGDGVVVLNNSCFFMGKNNEFHGTVVFVHDNSWLTTYTAYQDTSYTLIHPDVKWIGVGTLYSYGGWLSFPKDFKFPSNLLLRVDAGLTTNSISPVTITVTTNSSICGTMSGNIIVKLGPGVSVNGCGTIKNNATIIVPAGTTLVASSIQYYYVSSGSKIVIEEGGLFFISTSYNSINFYTSYDANFSSPAIENYGTIEFLGNYSGGIRLVLWEPPVYNSKSGVIHVSGLGGLQFNGGGRNEGTIWLEKDCQIRFGSLNRDTKYGPVPSNITFRFGTSTILKGTPIPQPTLNGYPRLATGYHLGVLPFSLPVIFDSGYHAYENITLSINGTVALLPTTSVSFRVVYFQSGNLTGISNYYNQDDDGKLIAMVFGYIMVGPRSKIQKKDVPKIIGVALQNTGNMSLTDSVIFLNYGGIINSGKLKIENDGDWPQTFGDSQTGMFQNAAGGYVHYQSSYGTAFPYPVTNLGNFESSYRWAIGLPFATVSSGVLLGTNAIQCINNAAMQFKDRGTIVSNYRYFSLANCSLVFLSGGIFNVKSTVQLLNTSLSFLTGSVLFEDSRMYLVSGDYLSSLYVEEQSKLQVNNTYLDLVPSNITLFSGVKMLSAVWPSAQMVGKYPGLQTTTTVDYASGTLSLNFVSIGDVPTLNLTLNNITVKTNTTYVATILWEYSSCPVNATVAYFVIAEKLNFTVYTTKVTTNQYTSHKQQIGFPIQFQGLVSCVVRGNNGYPTDFGNSTLSEVLSVIYPPEK